MKKIILIMYALITIASSFTMTYSSWLHPENNTDVDTGREMPDDEIRIWLDEEYFEFLDTAIGKDPVDTANNRLNPAISFIVTLSKALCPLSMLVIIALLLFSRNEKNVGLYLKILSIIFFATLIILLIGNGTVNSVADKITNAFTAG